MPSWQKESEMISERTKAALAAAKKRGKKLGGYREGALEKANAKRTKAADKQAKKFAKVIVPLKQQGLALKAIADRLNEMGIATVRGGTWEAKAVSRVLDRLMFEGDDEYAECCDFSPFCCLSPRVPRAAWAARR
jgi:DNA invertase Pin-like site-specific DNA recombinase